MAVKRSRQEHKEYSKAVTQENELLQKKNVDLHEFKTKKVNDERNERIRKKKELKKANQKEKRASIDDNGNNVDAVILRSLYLLLLRQVIQLKPDQSQEILLRVMKLTLQLNPMKTLTRMRKNLKGLLQQGTM